MLHLTSGMLIEQRDIINRLSKLQYTRNDQALQRSYFRVRGEVIDIFLADLHKIALLIELFDDKVDQLSLLDALTGRVD